MSERPLVTIVIPCRNEERFIARCLESVLENDYPQDRMEVLVVDGMSDDRSVEIIMGFVSRHACVQLLRNSRRNTPSALNLGIKRSAGQVLLRMDAHAECPKRFVSTCVRYLAESRADLVGGPLVTEPGEDTLTARSIALATAHPFGVGNSPFRTTHKPGFVDTVPFWACRASLFERVGLFDERLHRNQDNEFSSRVVAAGGSIYMTPELTVRYYNQATVLGLLKQAWRTGMWNVRTVTLHPRAFRWRHFVPFALLGGLLVLGFFAPSSTEAGVALGVLLGAYCVAAVVSAIQIGAVEGLQYVLVLPLLFSAYHLTYGLGTFMGVIRTLLWPRGWPESV